jgi:hypothetical protein
MPDEELADYLSGPPQNEHPELHQSPDWGHRGHPYSQPMPWLAETEAGRRMLTEAEYRAALPGRMKEIAGDLSEKVGLTAGMRFEWTAPGDDEATAATDSAAEDAAAGFLVPPGLLDGYASMGLQVSRQLLGDSAWPDFGDLLRRALNGEKVFNPPPPPTRHRCLACWLVSLLPGHDRCEHGWLESGCEECGDCW